MKELSPELYQQIEKEALDSNKNLRDRTDYEGGYIQGLQDGYYKGATKYALLLEDSERRNKEWAALLSPLLDYGHTKEANIPLGASITATILERAKAAVEMGEALAQIANGAPPFNEREAYSWIETARQLANEALSEGDKQKEGDNGQERAI